MNNKFDELSSSYDSILNRDVRMSGENGAYFGRHKAERIKSILGNDFSGKILDYGCGIGLVARSLLSFPGFKTAKVYGYDTSTESIKACRQAIPDAIFLTELDSSFHGYFDAIILANVFHHVRPAERDALLLSVLRLLKADGYLFIFEHNPLNPLTQWIVKMSPIDRDASLLWPWDMKRLLRRNGIVRCQLNFIVFFPRILRKLRPLESLLGFLPWGAQYLCVAKSIPEGAARAHHSE